MLPRLLRHCYCYADSRFSNPIVPARTRQGKSSRFDVLIRPSDASGNSFPRTLPMHKVELRRQVGALVRGKNGRGFSRHAGVYSSDVGRSVKPTRLSLGDGCIPAVPASVSPGFVVPLTHLADQFFDTRHRTRVTKRCGRIPVPVPPRIHGRAGTAGTIARIGGENDPHGFPTCPTAFRDLRGLCFETLTGCPRSNRKIRISPCPIPRSHGGIPVTGTASITRFPTILRDASIQNRRV